ncbi:ABC transporter substrate-binding protein [Bifidobacterium imperatoris]|uniref:ABC transporter substrate-binding protein n=1 Tax=Bifidobacterium imperatoris TaxID=2020965 RepID=A0A2N5ITS3_9BIFI|nr:MetQ/NlpA family ABC transporter substrate-binding protein [Bifidobacterium imperatoris]PLS25365.1 ABC transporter substrate-binding protein [Bifidobacterium imperatoris]QSY58477.1 ABC transporter substrate-binding protein [Bifidobacterium imperatoris]
MATTNTKKKAKIQLFAVLIAAVVVILVIAGFTFAQKASAKNETVVTVGVVGNSDDLIWDAVQKKLDSENANIKISLKTFQDGIYTNQALANKELDLTAFQHYAFLEQEEKEKGYDFTVIGDSYISPLNLYSKKYKSVDEFKPGDKIAIPSNASNTGRALKVLDSAGLIKLKDPNAASPTVDDIAENPSGVQIELNDAAAIINLLPDYAGGITNTNFIIDAGMKTSDAIYQVPDALNNKAFKEYINVIVARTADKDNATYKKIVDAYHSKEVAKAINDNYKGEVEPAFKY